MQQVSIQDRETGMINSVESGQQKEMMSAHNPTFTLSFSTKEAIVFSNDRYTPRPPAKTSEQAANRRAAILKAGIQPFCIQGIPVKQR